MVGNSPVLCDGIVGWACLVEPPPSTLPSFINSAVFKCERPGCKSEAI